MYQTLYEEMLRFASTDALDAELRVAKLEYIRRTGDMFESDDTFERRLAAFLEWYVLDRPVPSALPKTPARLYIDHLAHADAAASLRPLFALSQSLLSIFEFLGTSGELLHLRDVLSGRRYRVFERRRPAGLESADLLEARLLPFDGRLLLSDAIGFVPREGRPQVLRAAVDFRRRHRSEAARLDLVHRIVYLTNRCARYRHVPAGTLFAELQAPASAASLATAPERSPAADGSDTGR